MHLYIVPYGCAHSGGGGGGATMRCSCSVEREGRGGQLSSATAASLSAVVAAGRDFAATSVRGEREREREGGGRRHARIPWEPPLSRCCERENSFFLGRPSCSANDDPAGEISAFWSRLGEVTKGYRDYREQPRKLKLIIYTWQCQMKKN